MEFRKLHPLFAAEAGPIDLRRAEDRATLERIRAGMDEFAVLVFHDQRFDDAEQLAFAQRFDGQLHRKTGSAALGKNRFGDEALTDISNVAGDGRLQKQGDRQREYSLGNRLWHTDASFQDPPGRYSMLHARVVPAVPADTEFADLRAAYDALDPATKKKLEGLIAIHSIWHSRCQLDVTTYTAEERASLPPVPQRIVRSHPGSHRKTLYLAAHASHIEGMPVPDGRLLLLDLMEHATKPQFVHAHKWREGDLVIWDNRCTMHRARPFDTAKVRDLRRVTTRDVASTLEQAA
jgi:alpha-ketoglutarate-dependent 2,4-dichlorophenoxyacetate dioxygenase